MAHVLFKPQGDCNMLPCVRSIIPFLLLVVQKTFSQDTTGWQIWVLQSLRDSRTFQGMLEGFGMIIPPFLQSESMQYKNHYIWVEGRDLGFSGSRADLSDLQQEKTSSINTAHLDLAQFTATQDLTKDRQVLVPLLLDQTFAFEMWFCCPIAAWYHPAHSTAPWCPKSKCFSTPQLWKTPKPVHLVLCLWDFSRWLNLFRPSMSFMELTHCSWSLCCKTGGNPVTLPSSSTQTNIAIFVFKIGLKLNQIWMYWNFKQPSPLLRRPSLSQIFLSSP